MSDLNYTEDELLANCSPEVAALNRDKLGIANNGPGAPGPCEATVRRKRGEATDKAAPSNKYHAEAQYVNGFRYDSKKEVRYAEQLILRIKAGELLNFIPHVRFPLGKGEVYELDFLLIWNVGFKCPPESDHTKGFRAAVSFVEVKGRDLPTGRVKRHMAEQIYHIWIEVV